MARPIRQDGTPYPRRRPVDWVKTRAILRHRQEHKRIMDAGYVELTGYGALPASLHIGGTGKYSDVCLHPDGTRIYCKPVLRVTITSEDK